MGLPGFFIDLEGERPHDGRMMGRKTLISCCLAALVALVLGGCHDDRAAECANGECICAAGADCTIPCAAPPCQATCEPDSTCESECANGDCTCEPGARCMFSCAAPPCHVACLGDHEQCDGQCANGTCTCGPNSECAFECTAPPCHAECEAGSSCSLRCPDGLDGNCSLDQCDGTPTACPDGVTAVCGVPCPEPPR